LVAWRSLPDNSSGIRVNDQTNPINPKISKSLSAFDIANNFVISYSYRIPFDKLGRPNRLTNGWTISGITHFAGGLPVHLSEEDDDSLLGTMYPWSVDYPNYTPGDLQGTDPRKANPATQANPYFNVSLFSKETIGHLGTANRQFFHGPGMNNWDMALKKELKLTESKRLEFRGEFFNTFNHSQFQNPDGNILSSSFGFVLAARSARIGQVAIKFNF
jgi:hypothetical protein